MTLAETAFEDGRDWRPYMLRLCEVTLRLEQSRCRAEQDAAELRRLGARE